MNLNDSFSNLDGIKTELFEQREKYSNQSIYIKNLEAQLLIAREEYTKAIGINNKLSEENAKIDLNISDFKIMINRQASQISKLEFDLSTSNQNFNSILNNYNEMLFKYREFDKISAEFNEYKSNSDKVIFNYKLTQDSLVNDKIELIARLDKLFSLKSFNEESETSLEPFRENNLSNREINSNLSLTNEQSDEFQILYENLKIEFENFEISSKKKYKKLNQQYKLLNYKYEVLKYMNQKDNINESVMDEGINDLSINSSDELDRSRKEVGRLNDLLNTKLEEILTERSAKESLEAELSSLRLSESELEVLTLNLRSQLEDCLLYTSPSPRDRQKSRMPSSA